MLGASVQFASVNDRRAMAVLHTRAFQDCCSRLEVVFGLSKLLAKLLSQPIRPDNLMPVAMHFVVG